MGMRGPRKETGNVILIAGAVEAPGYMSKEARIVWDGIAPGLLVSGLLAQVDVPLLAGYCDLVCIYRKAEKVCRDRLRNDHDQVCPEFSVMKGSLQMIRQIGLEFGFSPTARIGLVSTVGDKRSADLKEFLGLDRGDKGVG